MSTVNSSILWDNIANDSSFGNEILSASNYLSISYCNVRDRTGDGVYGNVLWGNGNIGHHPPGHDPGFVEPSSGNYRLTCSSACINIGDPDADDPSAFGGFPEDDFDVDGDSDLSEKVVDFGFGERILGHPGYVELDMGAFEAHGTLNCDADVNGDDVVNIADLLAVIEGWGFPGQADISPSCSGDGNVNLTDLLAVINGWGCEGPGYEGDPESMPQSIEDCEDACDNECGEDEECLGECMTRCIEALCEAEIIDCD